LSAKHAE